MQANAKGEQSRAYSGDMENTSQDRTDSKICKTRQMNHRIICKTKVKRSSLLVVKATVCTSETGVGKWRKDQVVKDQDEQVKTGSVTSSTSTASD